MKSRFSRAVTVAAVTLFCAAPLTSHAGALANFFGWLGIRPAPAAPAPKGKKLPPPAPIPHEGPGCVPSGGC